MDLAGSHRKGDLPMDDGLSTIARKQKEERKVGRPCRELREIPLTDLPLNVEALVTRIDSSSEERVHRLASLGILPGASLFLIQNRRAFLACLDRYQVAFDESVAKAVWVVPVAGEKKSTRS